jgi:KDO2-lipid IV(A) lauroyltransferase
LNGNLFNVLTALVARLPMRLGYAIADALVPVHYYLFGQRRRAVLDNLSIATAGATRKQRRVMARRIMRSYNRMMFEFFRLPRMSSRELNACVCITGLEHVEAARQAGRGVIVTSCHIGNWELGAVQLARQGYPVTAVAGVQFGRWLADDVRAAKENLAVSTVSPEDGFRKLWRALGRNEVVALMVDGDIFSTGERQQFLGRPTPWPAGPGVLSERTGAPIIAAYCERKEPGRFQIVFEPALDPNEKATALNAAVAATSSRHVGEHIDQWCMFRSFWPSTESDALSTAASSNARVEA